MKNKWILRNRMSTQEFDSFPYAFRNMFAIVKKSAETGKLEETIKSIRIISPQKDSYGDPRKYNYTAACEMAKASGLLSSDDQINSKEFKRK